MKIVHIITRLPRGGAEENTIISCNGQVAAGHDVTLIIGKSASAEMLNRLDSKVTILREMSLIREIQPLLDFRALWGLYRTLKQLNPDIIHTHHSKAGILGRLAGKFSSSTRIVHTVHILPYINVSKLKRLLYISMEKITALMTDRLIMVSDGVSEDYINTIKAPSSKCQTIYSGFDLSQFQPEPVSAEETSIHKQPAGPVTVLLVSALEERKQIRPFLQVFKKLSKTQTNVRLKIAGEGPLRETLEAYVTEAGLKDLVTFLGYRKDVAHMIRKADICVHTSLREGLPRTIIQYAVSAKPIIATDIPSVSNIVHHGKNGYPVSPTNLMAMLPLLTRLIQDAELRHSFTQHSNQMDFSKWDQQKMVDDIETLYREIA